MNPRDAISQADLGGDYQPRWTCHRCGAEIEYYPVGGICDTCYEADEEQWVDAKFKQLVTEE